MFDNEGHFIDDPLAIVNAKPDFEGMGEIIPVERNCIVIDGVCYVLREAEPSDDTICLQCALNEKCRDMCEYPICQMIHHEDKDSRKVYKIRKL